MFVWHVTSTALLVKIASDAAVAPQGSILVSQIHWMLEQVVKLATKTVKNVRVKLAVQNAKTTFSRTRLPILLKSKSVPNVIQTVESHALISQAVRFAISVTTSNKTSPWATTSARFAVSKTARPAQVSRFAPFVMMGTTL